MTRLPAGSIPFDGSVSATRNVNKNNILHKHLIGTSRCMSKYTHLGLFVFRYSFFLYPYKLIIFH